MKRLSVFLSLALILCLTLSGTAFAGFVVEPTDFPRYEETVVLTQGRSDVTNRALPPEDTLDNNDFTRYLEEKFNIRIVNEWVAADGNTASQKISLSLATGEMPDLLVVDYATMLELYENDMIADLTEVYEQYATPLLRSTYDSFGTLADGSNRILNRATIDGQLMALPNCNIGYQQNMLWVRTDWLDKLGLEMPTTLEDIKTIARAFIEQDPDENGLNDTIGLTLASSVGGTYGSTHEANLIFGLYGAYPRQWIRNAEGEVVYGSVQPEMKDALAELNAMYEEGLIDHDFAVRGDEINSLVASGKVGLVFGSWWSPDWPLQDSVLNDPTADWRPVVAPLDEEGNARLFSNNPSASFLVISKECEHPEAALIALSHEWEVYRLLDPNATEKISYFDEQGVLSLVWTTMPIPLQLSWDTEVPEIFRQMQEAIDTGSDEAMDPGNRGYYAAYTREMANHAANSTDWAQGVSRYFGIEQTTNEAYTYVDPVFFDTTETMQMRWATLEKMEDEMLLKVIMGEAGLDAFDEFVSSWLAGGGEQITQEVREAVGK